MFCAFTREWLDGDVAVADGRIAGVGQLRGRRADRRRTGATSCPGFIDAHMHIESSKLTVAEFARRGARRTGRPRSSATRTRSPTCSAPTASHWLLDACDGRAARRVRDGAVVRAREPVRVAAPAAHARRHGGDPAPPPRARRGRDDELPRRHRRRPARAGEARLPARRTSTATRRACMGRACDAYLAAGHPLRPRGLDLRGGAARSAGAAVGADPRGLERPQPARPAAAGARATGRTTARSAPTTASPTSCCARARINHMCRVAVARGHRARGRLLMASLHGARCHGLTDRGAIAPGYRADFMLLDDLVSFRPWLVLQGRRAWSRGRRGRRPSTRRGPDLGAADRAHRAARPLGDLRVAVDGGAGPRDRLHPDAARSRTRSRRADRARRRGRRRPVARPGQDRRGRAPPRHRPGRPRLRAAASACGAARSPRRSPTTPTTSWCVGVSDDGHGPVRARAWRRSAAASWSSRTARVVAELALPMAGLLSTARPSEVVAGARAPEARAAASCGVTRGRAVHDAVASSRSR